MREVRILCKETKTQTADNFTLHEELGKEYERQHRIREERGGKTLRHLVAIANRPRYGRRRIPRRSR